MSLTIRRPALFLDRDGVINVDRGYVARPEDFVFIPGAADAIAAFNARNWLVFVVTNQTGIAFGHYSLADMEAVHAHMETELSRRGARIDRIYHTPFHPDGALPAFRHDTPDRKPGPGMLMKAMADFPVDAAASFMVGDKPSDMEAARAAGVAAYLFKGGDLASFCEAALADLQSRGA